MIMKTIISRWPFDEDDHSDGNVDVEEADHDDDDGDLEKSPGTRGHNHAIRVPPPPLAQPIDMTG